MFWQREAFRTQDAMTFNQTYELDLPRQGQLGSLLLYASSVQTGQPFVAGGKWRLIDFISKIEVIGDGATVIKSFDGRQALASAYNDDEQVPAQLWRTYSNTPHRQFIPIHFGRKFMDEVYGLDLTRFQQVTLRITNTATATQFTTNILLDVLLYWKREDAAPFVGYLREEEWAKWQPVAGSYQYNQLPIELPIRRILLRARPAKDTADELNNSSMFRLMSDIDFNFRTGATRVYKGTLEDLAHAVRSERKANPHVFIMFQGNAKVGIETDIGYVMGSALSVESETTPGAAVNSYALADVQDGTQQLQTVAADNPISGIVMGDAFGYNTPLFYARRDDMADILDPNSLKIVNLNILCTAGTTVTGTDVNAENAIVLSRLVR